MCNLFCLNVELYTQHLANARPSHGPALWALGRTFALFHHHNPSE